MPTLNERPEDIPLLVWHFLETLAVEHQKPALQISQEATDALVRYSWPGNVRELKNLIENLVVFARQPTLSFSDLPAEIRDAAESSAGREKETGLFDDLNMNIIERQAIIKALEKTGGNRGKAAEMLGIGLRTLQKKLKDYGMTER
jgi:DNA-binding NtrC family response regulator